MCDRKATTCGSATIHDQLRQAGLRATEPRAAVLEWLAEHPHATVNQIGEGVRRTRISTVSTQALYNVLDALVGVSLVRRIRPAGHPARYEQLAGDNHHHLVCRHCGHIEDTDCRVDDRPCLTPPDDRGYVLDETEVLFWGTCIACAQVPSRGLASAQGGH